MTRISLRIGLIVVSALLYGRNQVSGSDLAVIKEWLAKPLLAPDQPQVEIERFIEARIPRMPQFATREEWERQAQRIREEMLAKVIYRGKGAEWRDAPLKIDWQEVLHGDETYRIKKLRFEALPGLWVPALLYEPVNLTSPTAVAMNINGHDGNGKAAVYKQIRCINQAKRGMLALNVEWLGMGQLRGTGYSHTRMNQLDLCGTCGMAPFYLVMKRGLDVLLSHPHADPARVAVAGLSGGGWQTIFISSLDTRVTLSNPVAGYSSFLTRIHHHSDLGDSEQTPNDMATVADYSHLTALLAPRATLLTYNIKDECCFASDHALPPLLEAATPIFKLYGQESRLRSHVNHDPGTHNFERDNREAHYRKLVEHFLPNQPGITPIEIDSKSEVRTAEQLQVTLPEPNADFNSLAKVLMKSLPLDAALPTNQADLRGWQERKREALKDVLHTHDYPVAAEMVGAEENGGITATMFRLRIGETWTVPVVELSPENPTGTTLIVADTGRANLADAIQKLLQEGRRVVAPDPYYLGESHIKNRAYLWALLVQTVGDRPAGLQASQLAAIARWLERRHSGEPIELSALGERLSFTALCAAAIEPKAIQSVRLSGSLASLREVIERNEGFDSMPELFCFGLLEKFDVQTVAALCVPREVRFNSASDRHRSDLAGLRNLYKLAEKEFDPVQ
jgi:hypothetical protein